MGWRHTWTQDWVRGGIQCTTCGKHLSGDARHEITDWESELRVAGPCETPVEQMKRAAMLGVKTQ